MSLKRGRIVSRRQAASDDAGPLLASIAMPKTFSRTVSCRSRAMKVALHIHTHQVEMVGLCNHCGNAQGLPDYCIAYLGRGCNEIGLKGIRWPRWDETEEFG